MSIDQPKRITGTTSLLTPKKKAGELICVGAIS